MIRTALGDWKSELVWQLDIHCPSLGGMGIQFGFEKHKSTKCSLAFCSILKENNHHCF
jgi:hypothetical protein